jgi:uncharacterized repeat protein (TIGR01451 family)
MLLAAGVLLASGCGLAQNPSYFPYLLPTGDIIRTHAKPPGFGNYANFDPYACRLEVRPLEASNPVGTQHVLIATIYDNSGQPRRGRRVEWMLEGVGHIVEVDESGLTPGRGYKVDNRYAVSYTDYKQHVITRGNDNPNDDFTVRPGQSWCVISSPVEGDTHVTVYAPEVFNWDRHKLNVTIHWINAGWSIPPPAANRIGAPHTLATNVFRYTDRMPLANYRVRYTILDGPPAVFLPSQQPVAEAISDLQGNATVQMLQQQPQAGVNRIGIEIIRPPDPCCPTGPGIIIGRGETVKEWVAPGLAITKVGPPAVGVGQPFSYTITVSNTGRIAAEGLTVRDAAPEGLRFLSSQPPANQEGGQLIWTLAALAPGQSAAIQVTFQTDTPGTYTNTVSVTSADGLQAENRATTQVTTPQLGVTKIGPATAVVGMPISYQITVTNGGSGPATNVMLTDQFDQGLEHQSGANPLELPIGTLPPGGSRMVTLTLTPRREGQLVNRVTATADGGLTANAEHPITVTQPRLTLRKTGPAYKFARSQAEFNITVGNPGNAPLANVVVRDRLPPELVFVQASQGGQPVGGEIVWNLGTLQPGEEKRVQLTARAEQVTPRAVNVVTATADPNLMEQTEAAIEIRGAPGLRLEALDTEDPVEVGGQTTYRINVTNTGTLAATGVQITAEVPPQMKPLSGVGPGNALPQIKGNEVVFPVVDTLEPGARLDYSIVAQAVQPGDVRFRVRLRSKAQGAEPVIEEESTNIIRPLGVNGGAPPGPPGPP